MTKFKVGDRVVYPGGNSYSFLDREGHRADVVAHAGSDYRIRFDDGRQVTVLADSIEHVTQAPSIPSRKLYLIGSLRNPRVQELAAEFRKALPDWEVFDDWQAAGPEADDYWRDYEKSKGHDFITALKGHAAQHVFNFDKGHLDTSDAAILILPAGKSGHLELGYMVGKGKYTAIMLDDDPDRFDVMYAFVNRVTRNLKDIVEDLNGQAGK